MLSFSGCLFLGCGFCINSFDLKKKQITELEQELKVVEQKRVEYEEFIEEESQSQGRNMQLEENQVSWKILFFLWSCVGQLSLAKWTECGESFI